MDDLQSLSEIPDKSDPNGIENWLEARSVELSNIIAQELLKITTEAYEAFIASVDETVVLASGDIETIDSIPAKWNVVAQAKIVPQLTQTFLSGALFAYSSADDSQTIPPSDAVGWANVVNQQAVEYAAQASNRLRDVGNTVWNDIRKKVSKSIAQGNSTEMLKSQLEQLGRFSEYRADTIARTETSGAYLNGNWNGDQALGQYGPVEKVWVVVGDARTRPTHFAVAQSSRSNPVPFNEPFTVGGVEMMFPHSPGAPAGEVVNCRCYYDSYYAGDKRPDGSIVGATTKVAPTPVIDEPLPELIESKLGSEEFTADAWTPIDESMYAEVIDRFVPQKTGKVFLAQRAELRAALQQSPRKLVNGDMLVLDQSTITQVDFDNSVKQLQELRLANKQAGKSVVINFYDAIPNQSASVLADASLAYSKNSMQQMRVSKMAASGSQPITNATNRGFFQTSSMNVSMRDYTLAHEWGHLTDEFYSIPVPKGKRMSAYQAKHDTAFAEQKGSMSRYGLTDRFESYAETFADFWTSGGKSKNSATQAYAKLFGWKAP